MATVQIADIYDPLQFSTMAQEAQIERNAFIQSGVQVASADLSAMIGNAGFVGEIDNIKPLDLDEPSYSSDDPTEQATHAKLGTQQMKWRKAARNKSWAAMDLARGIALSDPVTGVNNRIGAYWSNDNQKRVIHSLVGIMLANVATRDGDLVFDVSTDAAGAATEAEKASALNFLSALEKKGDSLESISAFAVHSTVYYGLLKNNLIEYIQPSADVRFATFQGRRVIVDDGLPVTMGVNRPKFTSVLFGAGAIAAGEGVMKEQIASELHRDPGSGNGGGQDVIYSRRTDIIMPVGFSWIDAAVAKQTATWAELENPANWAQVWDSKNINLSFLVTNG